MFLVGQLTEDTIHSKSLKRVIKGYRLKPSVYHNLWVPLKYFTAICNRSAHRDFIAGQIILGPDAKCQNIMMKVK